MKLSPLMLAGTGSDVGKSVIAAGFCRIFLQDGYCPAPFKAQNMALNSYATPDGLEIGRAQATQAEAAGVPCHTDMNPILIKPTTDQQGQVIINGKVSGNEEAAAYFNRRRFGVLREVVHQAFDRLSTKYNPIVMEGAGSISEINLRETDIVNLSMAEYAKARVILVADIDRGGVFASVYGSIMLLTEEERKLVRGILINKFRGDISLFQLGVKMMEELCGIPVLGVVPYYQDIYIEEEDSLALSSRNVYAGENKVNVAVVLLRHLSNFTDFKALELDPRVHLYYTNKASEIEKADIILLPGSKNTLSDLMEIRNNGVAQSIMRSYQKGASVVGICGGLQLMGEEIADPMQVEGAIERMPGLGLLPVSTVMEGEKITRQVEFKFLDRSDRCKGYEIHMGRTTPREDADIQPLNQLQDGSWDGWYVNERCYGSYMHGLLDNQVVRDYLLAPYIDKLTEKFDFEAFKEEQYNKLAAHIRAHVDIAKVYEILK